MAEIEQVDFSLNDQTYQAYVAGGRITRIFQAIRSTRTDPHYRTIWEDARPVGKAMRPIFDRAMLLLRQEAHTITLDQHRAIAWEGYGCLLGSPNAAFFRSYVAATPQTRHYLVTDCAENMARTVEDVVLDIEAAGLPRERFSGFYGLPEALWEIARVHPHRRGIDRHKRMAVWRPELAQRLSVTLIVLQGALGYHPNRWGLGVDFLDSRHPHFAPAYQAA